MEASTGFVIHSTLVEAEALRKKISDLNFEVEIMSSVPDNSIRIRRQSDTKPVIQTQVGLNYLNQSGKTVLQKKISDLKFNQFGICS